jgi:hypothetical protein
MTEPLGLSGIRLRKGFFLLLALICAVLPSSAWGANCYLTDYKVIPYAGDAGLVPLKVIAFGTSLTWGDGLKEESTYRYLVASYVGQQTKRTVAVWTFAHSAAYLTDASDAGTLALSAAPSKGDLNGSIPAVEPVTGQADDGQADCALNRKDSLRSADLILLDGCINEVNAVLIVAPWTKDVEGKTQKYCQNMQPVLGKLVTSFPKATIMVVNYYPIVSQNSSILGRNPTHRLETFAAKVNRSQKTQESKDYEVHPLTPLAEKNVMADNSELFYQTSKRVISDAIDAINSANPPIPGEPLRAVSVTLPEPSVSTVVQGARTVDLDWAYGAPKTHLWLLPFPLFLGLGINRDDKFVPRWWECLFHYPFFSIDRFVNEVNAGFHPTTLGAATYAKSIEDAIPPNAWKAWETRGNPCPPVPPGSGIQPAYSDLTPEQQNLFESFYKPSGCNPTDVWGNLSVSQRLEFAGGTQALYSLGDGLVTSTLNGLDPDSVDNMSPDATSIVGSVPFTDSQYQFHIDVTWTGTAPDSFKGLSGWSEHISWLHPGMYGYQQNKDDIYSDGIVVLFKTNDPTNTGQFHIDMRFFDHFAVDNGNIAANYETYSRWYGKINGYTPSPEAHALVSQAAISIPRVRKSTAAPSPNLRQSITGFLTAWYIDQDTNALNSFVAQDNMDTYYNSRPVEPSPAPMPWNQIFERAFVKPQSTSHANALGQVIGYDPPSLAPGSKPLTCLNTGRDGRTVDPFAIIDISSLPPGSLLPVPSASTDSSFRAHLVSAYGGSHGNLAVVVYMVKPNTGFVREAAVTYWIREAENGPWELAGYSGVD